MITVVSCCYKRPEVFEIWLKCWLMLDPVPQIVVAGSPDDQCEDIALRYGIHYTKVKNQPVGNKWNAAHQLAREVAPNDYYLTTGSDDVMCQNMWDYYSAFKGDRLTLEDLYFIDLPTRKAIHWKGYTDNHRLGWPIGAHQLTSHEVMSRIDFLPFNPKSMAHEHDTLKKMRSIGVDEGTIPMWMTGGIGIDLKSKGSFSKFRQWNNSFFVNTKDLHTLAPELIDTITK